VTVADELVALGTATLGESGAVAMHPRIRAVWPGARVAAPAFTVACAAGDNLAIHAGVVDAPPASVLVVQVDGTPGRGYWGEVLTTAAEARGLAGIVIDGGVRDVDALHAHGFPVFSACIALPGAVKEGGGSVGAPVRVGDVDVATGDWVVGDIDGVVVVPSAALDDVLAEARARAEKEAAMFARLREGATTVELLGLDTARVDRPSHSSDL
jgi:4-hydroxy-4-methyl-2-oxoglutarate aldolase